MKKLLLLPLIFANTIVHAQNEFAATAFYREFDKIHADARAGFIKYKGAKRNTGINEQSEEFKVKLLLPLADSGRLVFTLNSNPYAEYYFQPAKSIEGINKRAVHLRDAVLAAYGKPVYAKTESVVIDGSTYSNTYYYSEPDHTSTSLALFRTSISGKKNKYFLSLRIKGQAPASQ